MGSFDADNVGQCLQLTKVESIPVAILTGEFNSLMNKMNLLAITIYYTNYRSAVYIQNKRIYLMLYKLSWSSFQKSFFERGPCGVVTTALWCDYP